MASFFYIIIGINSSLALGFYYPVDHTGSPQDEFFSFVVVVVTAAAAALVVVVVVVVVAVVVVVVVVCRH